MRLPFVYLALFGAACLIAASTPALAETVTFKAQLAGSKEVPPNTTGGKGALTFLPAASSEPWPGEDVSAPFLPAGP